MNIKTHYMDPEDEDFDEEIYESELMKLNQFLKNLKDKMNNIFKIIQN